MFYCEECKNKRGWPESMSRSRGMCAICAKPGMVCYDVASSRLPSTTKLTRVGNPVSEEPGHYVITVMIKHVTSASNPVTRGTSERNIEEMLNTTVKATSLREAIRRAKAVIDVTAPPTT